MIIHFTKENKNLYDVETIKRILNVSKSKVQRELKKQQTEIIKYKNLFLYPENTLFELMEIILIEKLEKVNDRLEQD
jgi:predicted transcriptional regulator